MVTLLVRVALTDRPGALGAVASRIGALRGDVVAVEIVERVDGRAVDEFVVRLPDEQDVPLLVSEIEEVDGATVEEVHLVEDGGRDRRLDAYDCAVALLTERAPERVLGLLASLARRELDAAWSAVVDTGDALIVAADGRPPAAQWLASHVSATPTDAVSSDIEWVHLAAWDLALMVGRPGWQFRQRERSRLAALARLADARWSDLFERDARSAHPSRVG